MVFMASWVAPCQGIGTTEADVYAGPCDVRASKADLVVIASACVGNLIGNMENVNASVEDDEGEEPLLSCGSYVRHLGSEGTVDSEAVPPPRDPNIGTVIQPGGALLMAGPKGGRQFVTISLPPCEISVVVPKTHFPGRRIKVRGPLGQFISVWPPKCATPGSRQCVRLAPLPEFRIEVPPGVGPGEEIRFKRENGIEVCAVVPKGVQEGDFFDVLPPALMVMVPHGAQTGDHALFRKYPANDSFDSHWCRALIPSGLQAEEYFPVRVPAPRSKFKQETK